MATTSTWLGMPHPLPQHWPSVHGVPPGNLSPSLTLAGCLPLVTLAECPGRPYEDIPSHITFHL